VGRKRGEYTTEIKMVYASPTMHRTRFRSKNTLRWTLALTLVCGVGYVGADLYVGADFKVGPYILDAQQQPPVRAGDQGALDTIQIRDNVWVIFGAGGNVTVHVGEDGVLLVDSGSEPMADKTLEAVKAITKAPIRMIIDTSADAEHVGGNDKVGAAGVPINPDNFTDEERATVLAHENVLQRMSVPKNRNEKPFPTAMWPTETFTSKYRSFYVNNDAVQVIRQLGAVTDGDVIVHLRRADVIATGDIVDLRHFPVIDAAKGGSIQGELEALNRLLDLTVPPMPLVLKPGRTLVVPGHGRVSDYGELVDYRDMVTTIKDIIEDMVKKGMTLEQVKAANPTAGYRKRWGSETGPWTTDMFVEAIYNGLKPGAKPAGKTE
jgi:glyoxylase-like metal-dependent hydrolase (beta-lactamase superfamily II)